MSNDANSYSSIKGGLIAIGLTIGISLFLVYVFPYIFSSSASQSDYAVKRTGEARALAQLMNGLDLVVAKGDTSEPKASTELVLKHKDLEYDFIPCTEEQQKLKVGDKVRFRYQHDALGTSEQPTGDTFCHLKIF